MIDVNPLGIDAPAPRADNQDDGLFGQRRPRPWARSFITAYPGKAARTSPASRSWGHGRSYFPKRTLC